MSTTTAESSRETEEVDLLDTPIVGPSRVEPDVGIVVIGRNEGRRLIRGLRIAMTLTPHVVYTDSNSDDGSREQAQEFAPKVHVIHMTTGPFTPSRGRLEGSQYLLEHRPEVKFIQFIDGDCFLDPEWITTGRTYLEEHPEVGAVFGRRREERVSESLFSRVMDVDWDKPTGESPLFGGDVLIRSEALRQAGNWSATTINAEDIDLAFRVRNQGWTIMRLAREMTTHDAALTQFREYWKRARRDGYGCSNVGWRYYKSHGRPMLRRVLGAMAYTFALPILVIIAAVIDWRAGLIGLAILLLLWLRMGVSLYRFSAKRGFDAKTSLTYAGLNMACKAAVAIGGLRHLIDVVTFRKGPNDKLIVYQNNKQSKADRPA